MRLTTLMGIVLSVPCFGQEPAAEIRVLTYHNDNARSGVNSNETILTLTNVKSGTFGKLFSDTVDGQVFAEPLYMSSLLVNGATHNVVFIATENNSIYAFDADQAGPPLWHINFNYGAPGTTVTPVPSADVGCNSIPLIGITSTPVIDGTANILYTVAKTKEVSSSGTSYFQRIHGVNVLTGVEAFTQIAISASVPGTCGNVQGSNVVFSPLIQHQRSALLLTNHHLYIGSASHCDLGVYSGWLIGYNTQTLRQVAAFDTTPDDATGECRGGIWMSGGGAAADSNNNIFVLTGNGGFNANTGGRSYSDSALKLSTASSGAVSVADYFTPFNQGTLDTQDLDFAGSGAAILLPKQSGPNPNLLVASGKFGTIYLINRDNMGQFNPNSDNVVQSLPQAISDGQIAYAPPVFYKERLYYAGSNDFLKGFLLTNGLFGTKPFATSTAAFGHGGAGLALSAAPGGANPIVWALEQYVHPGILHAYNAATLAELYNTGQAMNGVDSPGNVMTFSVPMVANGKVYVGTHNAVVVYGLK